MKKSIIDYLKQYKDVFELRDEYDIEVYAFTRALNTLFEKLGMWQEAIDEFKDKYSGFKDEIDDHEGQAAFEIEQLLLKVGDYLNEITTDRDTALYKAQEDREKYSSEMYTNYIY